MNVHPRTDQTAARQADAAILQRFAVRWAVLLAWHMDLSKRSGPLAKELVRGLEAARNKISSGCFSTCEVSCDLQRIEAALTSTEASRDDDQVDRWLALLGQAMDERADLAELLELPAIRIHFNDCRAQACACGQ